MKKLEVKIQIRVALPPEAVFEVFTHYKSYLKVPIV